MRWTIFHAKPTMTACRNCAGSTIAGIWTKPDATWGPAAEVAAEVSEAVQLGGREHRADLELLQIAAAASQTLEVDEYAGAAERRNQTADPRGEDLSGCEQLSALDPCAGRRDARKLD